MVTSNNIVLKVNLSGSGYSFVWREKPSFEMDVDGYLPKAPANVTGPNLAVCSTRLSTNSLFLGTVSRWGIGDEFDRKGLILSQGHLVDLEANGSAIEVCEYLLGLMRTHELYFDELGETLEYLAKHGKRNDAEDLIGKIEKTAKMELDTPTSDLINHLTVRLKTETKESNNAICVHTALPWSANLGLCALIGLQVASPDVKSVGGGRLAFPERYQLISSPIMHSGFRYVDLNRALTSNSDLSVFAPALPKLNSVNGKTLDEKANGRKGNHDSKTKLIVGLLLSTMIMTCATIFFGYRNIQQRGKLVALGNTTDRLPTGSNSGVREQGMKAKPSPSTNEPPTDQQTQAEDARLLGLIASLYDSNRATRISAITQLERERPLQDRIISLAVQYAREHQTNEDGIENTLIVLKNIRPETLVQHQQEIKNFIDEIQTRQTQKPNIPTYANTLLSLSGNS